MLSSVRNSLGLLFVACVLGAFAVLSHTICAPLFGVLLLGEVAACWKKQKLNRTRLIVLVLANVSVVVDYFIRVRPLTGNMMQAESWSPSSVAALQSAVQLIGWPTFVFAGLGAMRIVHRRTATDLFWLGCMAVWVVQAVALPLVVPFHADYLFPLALVMVLAAAVAVEMIVEQLTKTSTPLAFGFIAVVCMLPQPSLASYFNDGSSYDLRRAGAYVTERTLPTDRFSGYNCTVLNQYVPS